MNCHYHVNGETVGPVTLEQLDQLVTSGSVPLDVLVWPEGATEWGSHQKLRGMEGAAAGLRISRGAKPGAAANETISPSVPAQASVAMAPLGIRFAAKLIDLAALA